MLSSGCQSYGRSLLKIPELIKDDRRGRDCSRNTVENTIALPDRSSESGNLFHNDALRIVQNLSNYISDDYPTICTNPRVTSMHIRIEREAEELPDIRQYGVTGSKNARIRRE